MFHDLFYHQLVDHDDQHYHKYHHRPDVNVYVMNDVMNVVHVHYDHAHDHDVYDDRMTNEVNDVMDDDFVVVVVVVGVVVAVVVVMVVAGIAVVVAVAVEDVYICHKQNDFHRRNEDDIDYYMTDVLLLFFVIELIVGLNWK